MGEAVRFQVRGVLAGAYRGKAADLKACLTHLVGEDEAGNDVSVGCRVKLEHLHDEPTGARPTCPTCAAKYDALTAPAPRRIEVAWHARGAAGWKRKEVTEGAAFDRLIAKLTEQGVEDVRTRDAGLAMGARFAVFTFRPRGLESLGRTAAGTYAEACAAFERAAKRPPAGAAVWLCACWEGGGAEAVRKAGAAAK
jgi:hypothetical protein